MSLTKNRNLFFLTSFLLCLCMSLTLAAGEAEVTNVQRGDYRRTGVYLSNSDTAEAKAQDILIVGTQYDELLCLSLEDRTQIWKLRWVSKYPDCISIYGDHILFHDGGEIVCLDIATGKKEWSKQVKYISTSFPYCCQGSIHLTSASSKEIEQIDIETGMLRNVSKSGEKLFGKIAIGNNCVYAEADKVLYRLTHDLVKILWETKLDFRPVSPILHYNEDAYVVYTRIYKYDGETGELAWKSTQSDQFYGVLGFDKNCLFALSERNSSKTVWSFNTESGVNRWKTELESSSKLIQYPMIYDEGVFITSVGGVVHCLDLADGTERSKWVIGEEMEATPAIYNGQMIIGTNTGKLLALSLESGKIVWSTDLKAPLSSVLVVTRSNSNKD